MAPAQQQAGVDASLRDMYTVVLREMKPGSAAPPLPILIQDSNGPCGLIALVNAMMVTGKWSGEGVFNMEEMDPDPFMEMLNSDGLPWTVEELPGPVAF